MTEVVQRLNADSIASGLNFFLVEDGEVVGETGSLAAAKELARNMIGYEGLIDIHKVSIGRVGWYAWPEGKEEPVYEEEKPAKNALLLRCRPKAGTCLGRDFTPTMPTAVFRLP